MKQDAEAQNKQPYHIDQNYLDWVNEWELREECFWVYGMLLGHYAYFLLEQHSNYQQKKQEEEKRRLDKNTEVKQYSFWDNPNKNEETGDEDNNDTNFFDAIPWLSVILERGDMYARILAALALGETQEKNAVVILEGFIRRKKVRDLVFWACQSAIRNGSNSET